MMLLAIDVGNTNTKFAVYDGATWRGQWRASTDSTRTADEYGPWFAQLMTLAGLSFSDIKACIISTVVPQALFNLRNLSRRYVGVEPMVVGEDGLKLGIEVRIDKPSEAGADRLVNSVGAFITYGGPAVVIDSGTATTFDIVGADGAFEGGIISPGINLSLQALHEAAARLPRVEIRDPGLVIGKDTVRAMQSGIYWGSIEMIEGLLRRIRAEYGKPMITVATGGVASLFEGAAMSIDHFDQDLTSRGLLEIFKRNGGVI
ncbi:MAG: type III pantothenate kinase [Alphaproteobacteria bacterium]